MARFSCQNCGAELESTDDSLIGFCPYCGGQSLLKEEGTSGNEVERLIPFQITKEKCGALYQDFAKKIRYLPKELADPAYLQNFTGIYMPYYEYDAVFGNVNISGTKTVEHNSRYDVINTYAIPAEIQGAYNWGTPFDASRYLDDEISARAMPFDTSREMDFHPAYLSGFYADASTVPPELYYPDAKAQAEEDVVGEIGAKVKESSDITLSSDSKIDTEITGHHSVLYPMWFLTWRKKDRVAYAVINGESGKVVSDLPLDLKSFGIGCAVIALAVFLLLELLFQPTPVLTSNISLIAALCMAIGIRTSTKKVYEKQLHTNDKGWSGADTPAPTPPAKKPEKAKKKGGCSQVFLMTFGILVLIFVIAAAVFTNGEVSTFHLLIPMAALIVSILTLRKVASWQKSITEKAPILASVVLLLTVILNAAIVYFSPVNDLWYYLGDAVCIIGLVLSAIGMLRVYNISTTRPLPKLFDRGEV